MKITINAFSADSLRRAARKARAYQNKVEAANKELIKDLTVTGIEEAGFWLNVVANDYTPPHFTTYDPHVYNGGSKGDMSSSIRLRGSQVAFVEFGAGVHFNGHPNESPHPWGGELGFTIGSYGMHQGLEDGWYTPWGHYTHGTPAAMPLYHASVAIKQNARELAMTRFRGI